MHDFPLLMHMLYCVLDGRVRCCDALARRARTLHTNLHTLLTVQHLTRRALQDVLEYGQAATVLAGSATACVAVLKPGGLLEVANLGDSGLRVVRQGKVVFATEPQVRYFNIVFSFAYRCLINTCVSLRHQSGRQRAEGAAAREGGVRHQAAGKSPMMHWTLHQRINIQLGFFLSLSAQGCHVRRACVLLLCRSPRSSL